LQLRQNKMEFKLLNEKKDVLFNRREMQLEIKEKVIPSKEQVKEKLAEKYSVDKENIEVIKISGKFGVNVFNIIAHVYDSKEEKNKTVLKSKKQRDVEAKALAEANKQKEATQ